MLNNTPDEVKDMNTDSIAAQLLQGSRRVNTWREEIDTLVKLLMGLIHNLPLGSAFEIPVDAQRTATWYITESGGYPSQIDFTIQPWEGIRSIYNSKGTITPSGLNVRLIHQALNVLVSGLSERFPILKRKWEFLLSAAASGSD